MEGMRIGAYQIESVLGSGAMGTVHLARVVGAARGLEEGRRVAVKLLHPHLLAQPGFFKRFLREAEVGRQVDHENVVRTFDVDALEIDGRTAHFLVMEYVEGRTLRAMLQDLGTVPEALLREIARQVAAGLSAIHAAGVVHRDLKPENVLVTDDHQVRIMDLGVARLVEESVALTRKGEFAGSLLYAAPEQFRNEPVGPAADLYSLGVMLYELATGANPFRRDAAAQVIAAHLEDMPRTATEVGAELSPFLGEVLAALLAKRPEGRFESAGALRGILEQGERSAWWAGRERELLAARGHLPRVPVRRETELYGRETELGILREAWTRARQGEGNTILLEGEAGIGKTRLVDTFVKSLEGEEAHVLYGSYPPSGGMGGISDAIADHFGLRGMEDALRPYLTVTPSLVPAFAALVKHECPPTGSEPIQGDALHAVMVHLMRGLAGERPLVWVIDDLHFSDPDSRKIVLSLARAVEGHRVLLLTTTRPGLPEDELAHLSRLANHRRVSLGRLSPREVIQLLRDAFKSEMLAEKLGGKIAYKSDGVPFFVFEMIRGLREGQLIREMPDGTWVETQVIEEIEVPSAVKDLIEARLRDLSDEDRSLLDVCAVQGFEFDPALTACVREMKPVAVLERMAAVERRSGVVRGSAGCRFDHHQIQEVIYEALMPDLRREYHALLAGAHAERLEGGPGGEDAIFLTSHHLRGSRPEEAMPHLMPALEHLERSDRNEAAIDLAASALEAEGLVAGSERVRVLLTRGRCLHLLGRRDDERRALLEALELADIGRDPRQRALARRSLGRHFHAVDSYPEAEKWLNDARDLAREAGDRSLEGAAIGDLGSVHLSQYRHREARALLETHIRMARETGDRRGEATSLRNLGWNDHNLSRYEDACREGEKAVGVCRELGDGRGEGIAIGLVGHYLTDLGRFEEARKCLTRALELIRRSGDRAAEIIATGHLGYLHRHLGRYAEAMGVLERQIGLSREIGSRWSEETAAWNRAKMLAGMGEYRAAQEQFETALESTREHDYQLYHGLNIHSLGTVAQAMGRRDEARARYEEAISIQRSLDHSEGLWNSLLDLGRLLVEEGQVETALSHFREAHARCERHESRSIVLPLCLLARHGAMDPAEAERALARFEERLPYYRRPLARFLLWQTTGDPVHLGQAYNQLTYLRDHAPEQYRESMITNVPLHRDIMAAWKDHAG